MFSRLAALALLCFATESAAGEVNIKRDAYGVPHIYADNVYDLYYGYGFSIAQDRLFSLDMTLRSVQGRVAEVLGREYLDYDRRIVRNFTPASIVQQINALPEKQKDILRGYAAGINRWLAEIGKNPGELLPKQFIDFDFSPKETWRDYDVAVIFIGSMVHRFGDYNSEQANTDIFNALTAKHGEEKAAIIYNLLNSAEDAGAPTTIPRGDWRKPEGESLRMSEPERPAPAYGLAPANYGREAAPVSGFSNLALFGKSKLTGADAVLLNGPQFGTYTPAYTYSVGLHGAGFDVVGNTPYGYPAVMFAQNGKIAWGSTWGAGDNVDLFALKLNPENADEYFYKGRYVPFEKREVGIAVKGARPEKVTVHHSVHGVVIEHDPESGIAIAKKRSWYGKELAQLMGWVEIMQSQNYAEFLAAAAKSSINVNLYYADAKGQIGYVFGGHYPKRAPGHSGRLIADGGGSMDWQGIFSFAHNPKLLNPSAGMLMNWNNRPAEGVASPDMWYYTWGMADRVRIMHDYFAKKESYAPSEIWDAVVGRFSFADVNAQYFMPYFEEILADTSISRKTRRAVRALLAWDLQIRDADRDGRFDGLAPAIFAAFLPVFLETVFADDIPESHLSFYADTAHGTPEAPKLSGWNLSIGTKLSVAAMAKQGQLAYDFLNGERPAHVILKSLDGALAQLEMKHGGNMGNWRAPVISNHFQNRNFNGIPQSGEDEFHKTHSYMNRGTENNMTVFKDGRVRFYEIVPPGQSGFIAPNGDRAKHYDDQMRLYDDLKYKEVSFYRRDVEKTAVSDITLKTD